jgi:N-acylglucosamine 2-epimerase
MDLRKVSERYKSELLDKVIPFWEKHSIDHDFGGYFTCLNSRGNVYDTDKFVWLQARQVWMFSKLYNDLEPRKEWLNIALHGARFLNKYGYDKDMNWYFSLARNGEPLVQPYNIFSDCFAVMAFSQIYKSTGNKDYSEIANRTFSNILERRNNPKGIYNKLYLGSRKLKSFSLPMILSNLVLEVRHLVPEDLLNKTIEESVSEVMGSFYDEKSGLILENVNYDGSFSDTFEGRLLSPGHAIEAMWFIMDLAERSNDKALTDRAVDILLRTLEYGWDDEYGGIFYFMDIKGNPPQQLEWDQKLWWVHIEALIALIKAYYQSGNLKCLSWFEKVDRYTWESFPDKANDEWFGYLNRKGEILLRLKGGKWKGCFHLPRGLYIIHNTIESIIQKQKDL